MARKMISQLTVICFWKIFSIPSAPVYLMINDTAGRVARHLKRKLKGLFDYMGIKYLCRQSIIKYHPLYSPQNVAARLKYCLFPSLVHQLHFAFTHAHTYAHRVCQLARFATFLLIWNSLFLLEKILCTTADSFPNTGSIQGTMTGNGLFILCVSVTDHT